MALTDVLYARLRASARPAARPDHRAPARRASCSTATAAGPRPVGGRRRDGHQAGADKIEHLLALVRGGRGRGRHPVAAVDRQPQPRRRRSSTRCCGSSRRRSPTSPPTRRWRLHPVGRARPAPGGDRAALKACRGPHPRTSTGMHVNVAVGYGGRREIADAVRSLLLEHAARGTPHRGARRDASTSSTSREHLYTKGQPDPDLVIRTSGEQRLGGFLLWQSAHSEFYFCEAYWPDFRHVDFLRALRAYAERDRRFGALSPPAPAPADRRLPAREVRSDTGSTRDPTSGVARRARAYRRRDAGTRRRAGGRSMELDTLRAEGRTRLPLAGRRSRQPRSRVGALHRCVALSAGARHDAPRSSSRPRQSPASHAPAEGQRATRTFVLDTSVLLSDPRAMLRFEEHEVVLPVVVVTELEAKRHHPELGYFARAGAAAARRPADRSRAGSTPRCRSATTAAPCGSSSTTPTRRRCRPASGWATTTPGSCRGQEPADEGFDVTVVSKDLPMRVKASAVGPGRPRSTAPSSPSTPAGPAWPSSTSPSRRWTALYERRPHRDTPPPPSCPATPASCCSRRAAAALGRVGADKQVRLVRGDRDAFGLHGRSAEQRIALDLLLDPDIGIVSPRRPGRHRQVRARAVRRPRGGHGAPPAPQGRRLPAAVRRRRPGARLPARHRGREDGPLGPGGLRHPRRAGLHARSSRRSSTAACSRCCR